MDSNALLSTFSTVAQVASAGFGLGAAVALWGLQSLEEEIQRTGEAFDNATEGLPGIHEWRGRLVQGELVPFLDWWDAATGGKLHPAISRAAMCAAAFLGEQEAARLRVRRWLRWSGIMTAITITVSVLSLPLAPLLCAAEGLAVSAVVVVLGLTGLTGFSFAKLMVASVWPEKTGAAARKITEWLAKRGRNPVE